MGALVPALVTGAKVIGAVAPVVSTVGRLVDTVSDVSGYDQEREQKLALKQLQQQQRLQQQQQQAQASLEREKLAATSKADEEERRAALRRAVARQRAQFGASGVSSANGSAQAVLLGLFDETDEELARREELDNIRNRAIDLSLDNTRSLNVLQRTQLSQRQRLERATLF